MICRFASRASVAHSQPPRLREGLHVCFVDLFLLHASRTIVFVSPIRLAMFLLYTAPRVVSHILVASDRVRGVYVAHPLCRTLFVAVGRTQ